MCKQKDLTEFNGRCQTVSRDDDRFLMYSVSCVSVFRLCKERERERSDIKSRPPSEVWCVTLIRQT